jgi:DNA-directed RNA polymerase specialized sigma24 family protein
VTYPPGVTEEQFLESLAHCQRLLAKDFAFAYYDGDDIAQEMVLLAHEGLARYDPARPLTPVLHAHLSNRLTNLRRDKFQRSDSPCRLCYDHRQAEHDNGRVCAAHRKWKRRNSAKANLASPGRIDGACDDREPALRTQSEVLAAAAFNELSALIDAGLPAALRADYLRLLAGERVGAAAKARVAAAVRLVLGDRAPPEPGDGDGEDS